MTQTRQFDPEPTATAGDPSHAARWPRDYRGLRAPAHSAGRRLVHWAMAFVRPRPAPRRRPAASRSEHVGPKQRALVREARALGLKRAAGYAAGFTVLAVSALRAATLLAERGSDSGMFNVLLGLFTGVAILFFVSHDGAVARKQEIQ